MTSTSTTIVLASYNNNVVYIIFYNITIKFMCVFNYVLYNNRKTVVKRQLLVNNIIIINLL